MSTDIDILIGVVDTETGWTLTKIYDTSPVRVGKDGTNDLRLRGPDVADRHGEIIFGPDSLSFRNLARRRASHVDGERLEFRQMVALTDQSSVILGPYRIDAFVRRLGARRRRMNEAPPIDLRLGGRGASRAEPAEASGLRLELRPIGPLAGIGALPEPEPRPPQVEALAILVSGFCELKRHVVPCGVSTIWQLQEPSEIVDYLMDPFAARSRLDELREAQRLLLAHTVHVAPSLGSDE